MFYQLGRSLRAQTRSLPATVKSKAFSFTTALPSEFTYTRNDTASTIRNGSGAWVSVAANAPRFDHNAAGTALGLRFEPPRTNKCTQRNFAPVTSAAGIAVTSGDGTASVVADSNVTGATISGSPFTTLQNGNVIELTGGSGGTTFTISEQAGNTNAHSWRVCIAAAATGYNGTLALTDGSGSQNIQNTTANTYYEYTRENVAPNNAIRQLRITLSAGRTIRIIGTQFEEGSFLTSPILTNAATGSRQREVCVALGLNLVNWFDTAQGAIVCEAIFDRVTGFDSQYAFLASESTGLTNTMGFYLNTGSASQARPRAIVATTNYQNDDVHKPIANKRFPMAITWNSAECTAYAGSMRLERRTLPSAPVSMDRIYIGGRPFGNAMSGWIKSLSVSNKPRSAAQLAVYMFPATRTYKAIASGGQSNKHGYFRDQTTQMNAGEINAVAAMDSIWTTSENWLINGAENGSYAIKANDSNAGNSNANWWYDPATGSFGNRMADWEEMVTAFGISRIYAFDWDQGESDSASSVSALKDAWLAIFTRMRQVAGNKPVFITGIGRRGDGQYTNYNNVRQAQRELAAENAWIHLSVEKFIQPLADQVHYTDAGYGNHAAQHVRFMLGMLGETVAGGYAPPTITGASRIGTAVTVTIAHGAGSDFTPTTAIAGFHFFDNTTEITISSAVRTNATTITLTLASAPSSGIETLYYGYGSLYGEVASYASLVKDNSPHTLPLGAKVLVL